MLGPTEINRFLGGGNSNIFYFHPEPWGNDPIWRTHIFQMGWNHQPDDMSKFAPKLAPNFQAIETPWHLLGDRLALFP